MIPSDFAAFILTHGRPDRVRTVNTLRSRGYTGPIYIVIDDEDARAPEYRERFGSMVLQFSKREAALSFDEGDNFDDRRAIVYARNACFALAKSVGCRNFIELDDDYTDFLYRTEDRAVMARITLDGLFLAMVDFLHESGASTVAMSQGGDHIGGSNQNDLKTLRRKAMNTFVCSTDRPFRFVGRINEDVNTYTGGSRRGEVFFTVMQVQVDQMRTQQNVGGMSEMYLDGGTYLKSFYSVMYCPSGVKVGELKDPAHPLNARIHHRINWNAVAPRILGEAHRKA